MIVELRTYRTRPGMRDAFLRLFREKTMPEHRRLGMKIAGPYLSIDDDETFFFMRGFPDEDSRASMKARFYEGSLWKDDLEGVLMPMLERYDVVTVEVPGGTFTW